MIFNGLFERNRTDDRNSELIRRAKVSSVSSNEHIDLPAEAEKSKKRKRRRKTVGCSSPVAAERHWKKILQANGSADEDTSSRRTLCRCGKVYCHSRSPHLPPSSSDGFLASILHRFLNWRRNPQRTSVCANLTSEESDGTSDDPICGGSHSDSGYDYLQCNTGAFLQVRRASRNCTDNLRFSFEEAALSRNSEPLAWSPVPYSERSLLQYGNTSTSLPSVDTNDYTDNIIVVSSNHISLDTVPFIVETEASEKYPSRECSQDRDILDKDYLAVGNITLGQRVFTWPPPEKLLQDEDDGAFNSDRMKSMESLHSVTSEADFVIPFDDIELGDRICHSDECSVYMGQWHGRVVVHLFGELESGREKKFWNKVEGLYRIRHENIALFLGACVESQHLATVTSVQSNYISLYKYIHQKRDSRVHDSPNTILYQVTLGIGYLHSRSIVLGNLSSRNVFLSPKVKLSIMDFGLTDKKNYRSNYAVLRRGLLTYLAPELLKSAEIKPPHFVLRDQHTIHSDTYAFGSLVYEMLYGHFPFRQMSEHSIIWLVCSGKQRHTLKNNLNKEIKMVLESCWNSTPEERPSFSQLTDSLRQTRMVHKHHSTSEPKSLNRLGSNSIRI